MKILSKGTIVGVLAGTFILVAVSSPFIVKASEMNQSPMGHHQQDEKRDTVNPEQAAAHLSSAFDIDQTLILSYHAKGMSFRDIGKAAFFAKASGTSLEEVMSHKTSTNKWKDVSTEMGITKEQMKAARHDMVATNLNKKIGLDKDITLHLLQEGYHARDIGMAGTLAQNTAKSIDEVLSLKKINNTWSDIANGLGVDQETFKNDQKEIGYGFHHGHHKYTPDNQ